LTSLCDRRFTGLLLATKFLPAGDATAVKAVHDAVGIAFIQRLLLSLSSSQVRDTASHTQRDRV
jgi:Neurochondrin